jgi:hypothetical protein
MAGQLWERAEDGQVEGRGENPWSSQDEQVDIYNDDRRQASQEVQRGPCPRPHK